MSLILGNYCLDVCFLLHMPALLLWYFPPVQSGTKRATSKLMTSLVDHSGPTVEEEDGVLEDVIERT